LASSLNARRLFDVFPFSNPFPSYIHGYLSANAHQGSSVCAARPLLTSQQNANPPLCTKTRILVSSYQLSKSHSILRPISPPQSSRIRYICLFQLVGVKIPDVQYLSFPVQGKICYPDGVLVFLGPASRMVLPPWFVRSCPVPHGLKTSFQRRTHNCSRPVDPSLAPPLACF